MAATMESGATVSSVIATTESGAGFSIVAAATESGAKSLQPVPAQDACRFCAGAVENEHLVGF